MIWLLAACGAPTPQFRPTDEDLLVQEAVALGFVEDPSVRAALVEAVLRERVFVPVRDAPVSRADLEACRRLRARSEWAGPSRDGGRAQPAPRSIDCSRAAASGCPVRAPGGPTAALPVGPAR